MQFIVTEFSLGMTVDGPCDMMLACVVERYDLAVRFVAGRAGELEGVSITVPQDKSIVRLRDGTYRRWVIEPIIAEAVVETRAHDHGPIVMSPEPRRHRTWEMPVRNARADPEGSDGE